MMNSEEKALVERLKEKYGAVAQRGSDGETSTSVGSRDLLNFETQKKLQ